MKKSKIIEKIIALDSERTQEDLNEFSVPVLKELLSELEAEQKNNQASEPEPEEATGDTVLMFRPSRGELEVPREDMANMIKNGWSVSDDRSGTGAWVKIADLARLGYSKDED